MKLVQLKNIFLVLAYVFLISVSFQNEAKASADGCAADFCWMDDYFTSGYWACVESNCCMDEVLGCSNSYFPADTTYYFEDCLADYGGCSFAGTDCNSFPTRSGAFSYCSPIASSGPPTNGGITSPPSEASCPPGMTLNSHGLCESPAVTCTGIDCTPPPVTGEPVSSIYCYIHPTDPRCPIAGAPETGTGGGSPSRPPLPCTAYKDNFNGNEIVSISSGGSLCVAGTRYECPPSLGNQTVCMADRNGLHLDEIKMGILDPSGGRFRSGLKALEAAENLAKAGRISGLASGGSAADKAKTAVEIIKKWMVGFGEAEPLKQAELVDRDLKVARIISDLPAIGQRVDDPSIRGLINGLWTFSEDGWSALTSRLSQWGFK